MLTVEDIEYAVSQMERYGIEEGVSGYRKYYADEAPEEDGDSMVYEGPNLYFTIQFYITSMLIRVDFRSGFQKDGKIDI